MDKIIWTWGGVVRLPSVFFSSLSSVLVFLIGRRHISLLHGLVASLIFTGSSLQMFYAHDARVYTIFVFFTCYSLYFFLNLINQNKKRSKINLIGLTLVNILLCYSHFFGFIVILTQLLICSIYSPLKKYFSRVALSILIVLLSYSWYIPVVYERFRISEGGTWVQSPLIADLYLMLWRFSNTHVITILFLVILFCTILFKWGKANLLSNNVFKILIFFFSISYFGLFLVSLRLPVFVDRYLIFTSPVFYLLISISLFSVFESIKNTVVVSFISVILMFFTLEIKKGKKPKSKDLIEYIKSKSTQPFNVVITPEWYDINFVYYYNQVWFTYQDHLRDTMASHLIFPINTLNKISLLNPALPVILVDNGSHNETLTQYFEKHYQLMEERDFNGGLKSKFYNIKK